MLPPYKFQGSVERENMSFYCSLTTLWAVYPKMQSLVVYEPLLLRPKTGTALLSLNAIQLHACERNTSALVWGLVPANVVSQILIYLLPQRVFVGLSSYRQASSAL